MNSFADFGRWSGRRVLEIGSGMGGDLSQFLLAGADAIGIDASAAAVEDSAARLDLLRQPRRIIKADALRLPFADENFDLVWSWGVLHHTNAIERAIGEAYRVLKPRGEVRLMLYHRPSWVSLAAWLRWALFRGTPFRTLKRVVADHIESPGTMALTRREINQILGSFGTIDIRVVGTYWDRKFVPVLGRLAGSRLGWFALATAQKK